MKTKDLIIGGIVVTGVYLLVKSFQKREEYPIVEYTLPASVPISDKTHAAVMRWHPLLMSIGRNLQVEPAVLAAIIHRESEGMPEALRYEPKKKDYSYGLMQILSETARWLGFNADNDFLFEPEINIHYGAKYLKNRFETFGTMYDAVSAYNCGTPDHSSGQYTNQKYVDFVVNLVPVYRKYFRYFYKDYDGQVSMSKDIFDPSYFW